MRQKSLRFVGVLVVLFALAALIGCQGVSVGKQDAQTPASGQLTATPANVNFGSVQSGMSQSQSETLSNSGGSSLTISGGTINGTGLSMSGLTLPVTLSPGQTTTFSIKFSPESSGSYSGSVTISSNGSNPNLTISLSGSATAQTGQLSVTPTTINAGNVTVGTSGTKTATLNATGASVVVSSVGLGGTNPTEFAITGLSFPVTVSTSQPVSFTVKYAPQASGGSSAIASFVSNGSNSPTTATLTGTGVTATAHSVDLSWNASTSSDVVSYNIYRANYVSSCGSYSKIGSSGNTTYTDSSVVNGQAYCYEATAVNSSDQESTDSTPITDVAVPSS
ncbi:MAG TPA: choice-of-anchor D domain-containing protein [Candidatus Aquilonibacter sp.]|nr:choice-of-anchor D domain-containing protein [Candidatus Aquilonibacter sp.]